MIHYKSFKNIASSYPQKYSCRINNKMYLSQSPSFLLFSKASCFWFDPGRHTVSVSGIRRIRQLPRDDSPSWIERRASMYWSLNTISEARSIDSWWQDRFHYFSPSEPATVQRQRVLGTGPFSHLKRQACPLPRGGHMQHRWHQDSHLLPQIVVNLITEYWRDTGGRPVKTLDI